MRSFAIKFSLIFLSSGKESVLPPGDFLAPLRWDSSFPPKTNPQLNSSVPVFNMWVKKQLKCNPCPVQAQAFPDGFKRVGLYANEDVRKNATYITVPERYCLRSSNIPKDTPIGALISNVTGMLGEDPINTLVLWLLHEKAIKKKSFWFEYIQLLPRLEEMLSPIFWPSKHLKYFLEGSPLYSRIVRELDVWKANYQNLYYRVLNNENWKKSYFDSMPPETFNATNYLWARAILATRGIWVEGERYLVPLADLANASPFPGVQPYEALLNAKEDILSVATRYFPAGAEIVEDYAKPTWLYFLYHGFVPESEMNADHECILISVDLFPMGEATPFIKERREALKRRHFINYVPRTREEEDKQHTFCERSDGDVLIGTDLAQALFISRIASERFHLKHGIINEEQIAQIYGEIATVIEAQLNKYPSTTERLKKKIDEIKNVRSQLSAVQGRELLSSEYLLGDMNGLQKMLEKSKLRQSTILKSLGINVLLSPEERQLLSDMRRKASQQEMQEKHNFTEEKDLTEEEVVDEEL